MKCKKEEEGLVEWNCSDLYLGATPLELFYSTDNGATFPNIVTPATENDGSFEWVVPNIDTNAARVRAQCTEPSRATSSWLLM